jgi:pyridoxine 5-phosphate synthase
MVRLFINVDHVATLRQQRDTIYPDPVIAAGICELAGVDGITVHLREDRRHIQERDVRILRQTVRGGLNLEMAVVPSIIDIALQVGPDMCTLVPEKREERTTEGGLDLRGRAGEIGKAVRKLRDAGIGVSLFIDPEEDVARACVDSGRDPGRAAHRRLLSRQGRNLGGKPRAGPPGEGRTNRRRHGAAPGRRARARLRQRGPVAGLANLEEMSIGHAIVARAVMVGMERAVLDMRKAIDEGVRGAHRG